LFERRAIRERKAMKMIVTAGVLCAALLLAATAAVHAAPLESLFT
jgi:hypothetical protein